MTRLTLLGAPLAVLLAAVLSHPAAARHLHHHHRQRVAVDAGCRFTNTGRTQCGGAYRPRKRVRLDANGNRVAQVSGDGSVIGGRPAGCPHAYCGCGLRKYLGLSDKRLNLAWNWARMFPRVSGPRAGVAAVRHGHVMYIEGRAGNGEWLVRDYNSGGGLSRVHVRSVRGYVFVQPSG
jgi:hypothetical protein